MHRKYIEKIIYIIQKKKNEQNVTYILSIFVNLVCPEGYYGDHCMEPCDCKNDFYICHPVDGCICRHGYTGMLNV